MKKLATALLGVCLLNTGCSLAVNGTRNVWHEITLHMEECRERAKFQRLARQELGSQGRLCTTSYSREYAQGFEDGFVDFLMEGGSGQPPAVPPQRFWAARYESPEGFMRIQAWFDGNRDGAAAAMQSGYRRWVVLPSSLHGAVPPPIVQMPPEPPQVLPTPRVVPTSYNGPARPVAMPENMDRLPAQTQLVLPAQNKMVSSPPRLITARSPLAGWPVNPAFVPSGRYEIRSSAPMTSPPKGKTDASPSNESAAVFVLEPLPPHPAADVNTGAGRPVTFPVAPPAGRMERSGAAPVGEAQFDLPEEPTPPQRPVDMLSPVGAGADADNPGGGRP